MALPPSRRDTIGPPPRDVTDLARVVRHHGSYLRSLDPGILDGTRATPRPVPRGPSQLVGEDSGGDGGEDIAFWNTDRAVASAAGKIVLRLTYEPLDGAVHVRCGAAFLEPWEYVLDGQTVTYVNSHIRANKTTLTAAYAYIPTDGDVLDGLVLRGTTIGTGALPVETQAGDFVVIATRGSGMPFSDPRFPLLSTPGTEGRVYAGIATDISATVHSGGGEQVVVAAFVGGAAVGNLAYATDPSTTPLTVPAGSGIAAIAVYSERSSFVPGSISLPNSPPWLLAATDVNAPGWGQVSISYWFDATATSTPAVTPSHSGGTDLLEAFLLTLAGEE